MSLERAVAGAEGFARRAGFAVADLPETAGNVVADGLARLGPVGAWAGRGVAGLANVVGAAVAGAVGILVGVPAGSVRVVGGAVLRNGASVRRGVVGIGSSVGGAAVLLLGTSIAAVQRFVGAEAAARPLTPAEERQLRAVFGPSVGYRNVRIVQGRSGLFGTNRRPFTLGSTVYLKDVDLAERSDVLVHEVVHVWQYQHEGPRYAAEALGAQVAYGWKGRGAYDWEADLARGRTSWADFNKEAQGAFVQHLFAEEPAAVGRADLAATTLEALRTGRTWRTSARVGG